MEHYGTLGTHRFDEDVKDIRGADVYGSNDEKLGEIDDIIFDHSSGSIQYIVVDTGGWLTSRKFLVPGNRISERTGHEDDFLVPMTREQVHSLPQYDEKTVENPDQFRQYEAEYREKFIEGPILHKEGSSHVLTPEPDELPATGGNADLGGADVTPSRIADPMAGAAANPSKLRMRPAGTAARAEDTKLPGVAQSTTEAGWEKPSTPVGSNVPKTTTSDGVDDIGYGDINRTSAPKVDSQYPPSYADTVEEPLDAANDLHNPYPVEEGRTSRFKAFENQLRRNRVDITASCRSCDVKKEKAA